MFFDPDRFFSLRLFQGKSKLLVHKELKEL